MAHFVPIRRIYHSRPDFLDLKKNKIHSETLAEETVRLCDSGKQ